MFTTGQEESITILFLIFLRGGGGESLTNLLFIYTCNNLNQQYHKTVQLYGIQVKMIKHLFLNLPFVCY